MQLDSTASWKQDKRKTNNLFDRHCQFSRIGYTDFFFPLGKKEKKSLKQRAQYKNNPCKYKVVPCTFRTLHPVTGHLETSNKKVLSPEKGHISRSNLFENVFNSDYVFNRAYSTATQWVLQSCRTCILKQKTIDCKNLHYEWNSLWNRLECTTDCCC